MSIVVLLYDAAKIGIFYREFEKTHGKISKRRGASPFGALPFT